MARRTPLAGGFFIVIAILAGMVWGIAVRKPMDGILIGTIVGVAVAAIVWLVDRRRGRA